MGDTLRTIYVCSRCAGSNVHVARWINPNTGEQGEDLFDHPVPFCEAFWCDDCGDSRALLKYPAKLATDLVPGDCVVDRQGVVDVVRSTEVDGDHVIVYWERSGILQPHPHRYPAGGLARVHKGDMSGARG